MVPVIGKRPCVLPYMAMERDLERDKGHSTNNYMREPVCLGDEEIIKECGSVYASDREIERPDLELQRDMCIYTPTNTMGAAIFNLGTRYLSSKAQRSGADRGNHRLIPNATDHEKLLK